MNHRTSSSGTELTLRGRIERVTYASLDTGFAVLRVRPPRGARFTATGHVAELLNQAGLEGTEFQFSGTWTVTKYGRQFAFSSCRLVGSELLFFLSKVVKGLGKKLARQLIDDYGEKELVRILDQEPEKLLQVKGIKDKRLTLIKRSWHKHRSLRSLAEYLSGHGGKITPNLLIRIYNHFEDQALDTVRKNPYSLTEVRGIGFKTADRIALGLGIKPDSPERIRAAVTHVLVHAAENEGHCYLLEDRFLEMVQEILSSEDIKPDKSLIHAVLQPMVLEGILVQGHAGEFGLASYKYMEDWLKDFAQTRSEGTERPVISQAMAENFIEMFEDRSGLSFAPQQKEIILRVATEPRVIFGLAGYAGTGKTTVCRAILDLLSAHYVDGNKIVCCAFTGMASARLRKTTGFDAFTIHSLLKYKGTGKFEHGPDNPLPYKVIVLDEASMVNLPLFFRLARALLPETLLLLVGDPAQLPPIGAGNVFGDMLNAGLIPAVHLTRIYRQSEDSVLTLFANDIRRGIVPDGIDRPGWKDFSFERIEKHNIYALKKGRTEKELRTLREENNQAILDRILEHARDYRDRLNHPIWEFQILTPMRVGQLGTEILNNLLQDIMNPSSVNSGIAKAGISIREGDKVVHLQNRDMQVMPWDEFIRLGKQFSSEGYRRVFNGNVGLVTRIDPEAEEFYVVYPERVVVAYDFDHIGDIIELAYALTVHKAQGSQYRIVVIPLTNSHFIMLNNKWFYTAVTRAEKKVYLIGQSYALKRACTNMQGVQRQTWLGLPASGAA
ncbi:MAG TPA: ATPase [Thermodesulfobacteriaceae bacterium]|nr:ATPase [Thermodesulfobacteriaceae bacterium]